MVSEPDNYLLFLLVKLLATTFITQNNIEDSNLFFLQKSPEGSKELLLLIPWIKSTEEIVGGCQIFNEEDLINTILEVSTDLSVQTVSKSEMENLLNDCREFSLRRRRREIDERDHDALILNEIFNEDIGSITSNVEDITESPTTDEFHIIPIIFPGTKWCGAGAIATSFDDLGRHVETDRCCRDHDNCDDLLVPGEAKANIINESWFTKLSCECDRKFYECLIEGNTTTSLAIKNFYFNILNRECYTLDYPLTETCKTYMTFLKIKCWEYERNMTAPKEYRWISAKEYISTNGPLTTIV